ncbi:MAG: secretin N-terminal domain-containing protein [Pseudomonadota bacterium]|nr:secretin N-terminal domain-containing protein [Pseudomonadota bacterium]
MVGRRNTSNGWGLVAMNARPLKLFAPLILATLLLAGCGVQEYAYHDREAAMTKADYKEALAPPPILDGPIFPPPPIPIMQPIIAGPDKLMEETRLVTISVDETVPLKDALFHLAHQAEVDLELDPRIKGAVIFTARERPFQTVIRRIADMAGLRYKFEEGVLRVELDEPYHENYKIDYLNVVRRSSSNVSSSVDLDSAGVGGSGGGGGNASSSSISMDSEVDFWTELEANLTQIMDSSRTWRPSAMDEVIAVQSVSLDIPVETEEETSVTEPVAADTTQAGPSFTINKQAGIVSAFGTQRQHRLVEDYLDQVRKSVNAQVLIEARVLEVTLLDQFKSGVNWRSIFDSDLNFAASLGDIVAEPPFIGPSAATPSRATLAIVGHDLAAVVNLLQQFGTVRALSAPRLTALNNQSAVLKVAENRVFFTLDVETTTDEVTGDQTVTVSSEVNTVPVGLIISVQPSIDLDAQTISLTLRPTVTRVVREVSDPAVEIQSRILGETVESMIPVISVQEMDSVVNMRSGEVLVMGGLMQDNTTSDQDGIPGASDVPLAGNLFKTHDDSISKSELVIFLRATVMDSGNVDPADVDLYRRFGGDRRPLTFRR